MKQLGIWISCLLLTLLAFLPAQPAAAAARARQDYAPVLMYHDIKVKPLNGFDVTRDDFRKQLDWLQAHHYQTLSMEEYLAILEQGRPFPEKSILITFDDGWRDNVAYAEQLIGDGKLAPKHKDAVVAFLDFSEADTSLEFGEGDAKQPLATAFKSFLGELPKVVEFGEHATKDKAPGTQESVAEFGESADPERLKQHQAIQAHMAEHKVDYATAARAVLK